MISKKKILNASVLIVYDPENNVLLHGEMERHVGYAYSASSNALMRLARCSNNRQELFQLDLQMQNMDGF